MGSRAEQPNQLQGDPLGVESMGLRTRLGSGAAGSLQPDPVASLPRLLHGHGGEDAWGGRCWGMRRGADGEQGWFLRLPVLGAGEGIAAPSPALSGCCQTQKQILPGSCVSARAGIFSAFWLRQVPAGASLCHPRAGQDGARGCGGRMVPGTFGCPGAGFGTSHRQGGWRWDPQPTARLGADPLKAGTGNLPEWGAI